MAADAFLKVCGYGRIYDRMKGATSYVKRLGSYHYPRFHVYIYEKGDQVEVNLHLDQKAPVYEGQKAHQGEYNGPLVEKEAQRIFAISRLASNKTSSSSPEKSKIPWWKNLFN